MGDRSLLKAAALALAVGGVLGMIGFEDSAAAQGKRINWKMASAYPSKLVQFGSLGVSLSKKIERISGGNIRLKFFEPNILVSPLEMFDAISAGKLDAAWSTPGYWDRKERALALFSGVPFGPGAGEYAAWIYKGGGLEIMDRIYARHNIKSLICGVIAPEASGWFRKEVKTVDDLKGLRMRFYGLGAKVMEKVGVSTKLIASDDIYSALESGTIDATEYSMPAIDVDRNFHEVAKHYYFPGWHQQATLFELMMNRKKWGALTDTQKAQIEAACGDNFREGLAEGEAIQGRALSELKARGVNIHRWPPEILAALKTAWEEVAAELAAEDESFKEAWDSLQSFRAEYALWRNLGQLR